MMVGRKRGGSVHDNVCAAKCICPFFTLAWVIMVRLAANVWVVRVRAHARGCKKKACAWMLTVSDVYGTFQCSAHSCECVRVFACSLLRLLVLAFAYAQA